MSEWDEGDARLELRLRTWAIPAALVLAFVLVSTGPGHFLLRIFFNMWVHEVGHATAAWLCGYLAFPGPWLTPVASKQSLFFELLVLAALAGGVRWSIRNDRPALARALVFVAALQLGCAALLSEPRARQLIIFMGDGGCLVFGTFLMLTVYAREGSALQRGWLRWGFLAIGAAAFADVFSLWWSARRNYDLIPFGMNEGAGLSDPSVLSDQYGWSADQLVHRYVLVGCLCLGVLALTWALQLLRARRAVSVAAG